MPAERAPMRKVREVLRLRHVGVSERQIAITVGVSRSTVGQYLRRAAVIAITWPVPTGIDDVELERRLFTPPTLDENPARSLPDWTHVHRELKRPGVLCCGRNIEQSMPRAMATAGSATSIELDAPSTATLADTSIMDTAKGTRHVPGSPRDRKYLACDGTRNGLTFHSRDHLSRAHMNARPEANMADAAARDVESVGLVPLA